MPARDLRFRVLGPLEVEADGRSLRISSARQRAILGILLLDANRVVSTDRLISAIWGEDPGDNALSTLQVHVSKLRTTLSLAGDQPILTTDPGYQVRATLETLDLLAFEGDVSEARALVMDGLLDAADVVYRRALGRWRGRALADVTDLPYVDRAADRLDQAHADATAAWLEVELARGRHAEVIGELAELVDAHPYDEQLRGLLMVALYRSGRQADALATYHELRHILEEELGLDPGPELRRLEERILRHDGSLLMGSASEDEATRDVGGRAAWIAVLRVGGREVGLTSAVSSIGRASDRTVVVADESVSRRHAEIRRTSGGFTIVDLESTNGTRVNGDLVTRRELHDGDVILLGEVAVTFHSIDRASTG